MSTADNHTLDQTMNAFIGRLMCFSALRACTLLSRSEAVWFSLFIVDAWTTCVLSLLGSVGGVMIVFSCRLVGFSALRACTLLLCTTEAVTGFSICGRYL